MDDQREEAQVVAIDLNRGFEASAEVVARACFANRPMQADHYASLATVVSDLFEEAWSLMETQMRSAGFDGERIKAVQHAVTLAAWNQVLVDFGCSVRVIAKETR